MVPLSLLQEFMTWIFINPANESTSISRKIIYATLGCLVFASQIAAVWTSSAFFLRFKSIDLEQSMYCVFQIIACSTGAYSFLFACFSRRKIKAVFERLSTICNENTSDEVQQYLIGANLRSDFYLKWYYKIVLGSFILLSLVLSAISVLLHWIVARNVDVNQYYHPFNTIFPWNQSTFMGYIAEICVGCICCTGYFLSNGSRLSLFISICWFHRSFSKILHHSVREYDHADKSRNDKVYLCEVIRFHVSTKTWFATTADLYRPFILVQLMCSIGHMTCSVFQMELQLKHIDINILILIATFSDCMINLFVYCYFGKLATESYLNMSDYLYDSNWLSLSVDLRRDIVLMIGNMNRPLYYHGFGVVILNLETYGKILKTGATYYMALRTITSERIF